MFYTTKDLFEFEGSLAEKLLESTHYPWEALKELKQFIRALIVQLPSSEYQVIGDEIIAHKSVKIADFVSIKGPCIIGAGTELRHGAFLRGSTLIGENCVVGNSTELKNTLMLNHVQAPHFNYTGDSIFGNGSHVGAGVICSNVKSDKSLVTVRDGNEKIETQLKKFGAILGDNVEVGCNSVLNPGTVVGCGARIYPLSSVRGQVPSNCIYKRQGEISEINNTK